jgi:hypothetical protein
MDNTTHGCMVSFEYYWDKDQGMLIGVLGLGMVLGLLTGAAALITGQSFLMALWLYAVVGVFSTLTIALARYAFCGQQRSTGKAVQSGNAQ